ncbi:phosphoribosyltransferase family protein [uncultured Amnibacterium sp.]|uniref:phosphoribosyltransferase family protein n=1 Tax=uncultured Amnibacterium sp. TaxID=1631851 RepID=UPI0035CBFF48
MRDLASTTAAGATGWAERRLGIELASSPGPLGLRLDDLVSLAVRRNPRRAHLLVSTVLGKHRPTDPDVVRGAALLLGRLVARALGAPEGDAVLEASGARLLRALRGEPGAAADTVTAPSVDQSHDLLVIGYAETATALGQTVADALDADYLSSTRRDLPSAVAGAGFEEEHSHATSHRLLPDRAELLEAGTVVLVDDELTTGTTVLNTVAMLERIRSGRRYVVATLVDLRPPGDAGRLLAAAAELGVDLRVVALASGAVRVPEDVLARAAALQAEPAVPPQRNPAAHGVEWAGVEWIEGAWPRDARHHGRHGYRRTDRQRFESALAALAGSVADRVPEGRIHVLGTEELMYLPQALAGRLGALLPDAALTSSATTRSPVVVVDDPAYPIRSRVVFAAHDDPDDGPGERFAYNLGAAGRFDTIVVVVDERGRTPQLTGAGGLLPQLTALAARVLVAVVPDGTPEATA